MNVFSEQLAAPAQGVTISIVVYEPDVAHLTTTLLSLVRAVRALRTQRKEMAAHVRIVDNGGLPGMSDVLAHLSSAGVSFEILTGQGNVGYGRGHNLAMGTDDFAYHLVLNPDVDLDRDALVNALGFLEAHGNVGLLSPAVHDAEARIQYLCRRYPTLVDLLCRGFLPPRIRRMFSRRLAHYEMRDVINDHDIVLDPPIVSGCFMLFRTEVLKKLGGFDPRYFLYFEDYDLSLRTHDVARVAYVPSVRVIHHGGGASRKGFAHIRMFAASAFKFYNRFGWRLW